VRELTERGGKKPIIAPPSQCTEWASAKKGTYFGYFTLLSRYLDEVDGACAPGVVITRVR
jgi:hypothetical protein